MQGKISKDGSLYVERKGTLKIQICPHSNSAYCGDWCPLFQEYEIGTDKIQICIGNTIIVKDERVKPKKKKEGE